MGKKQEKKNDKKSSKAKQDESTQQSKRGRPRKSKNQKNKQPNISEPMVQELKQEGLIIHYPVCIKLIKILSHAGQVRVKTLTGDREELKKVQKKVEQKKKNTFQQEDEDDQIIFRQEPERVNLSHLFYFISESTKAKLIFSDKSLLDIGIYNGIHQYSLFGLQSVCKEYEDLLYKINLVCKELDDQFIKELEKILKFYFENITKIELSNQIVRFIRQSYLDFPYIKEWEIAKLSVYTQQLTFAKESYELQLKNAKYKKENGIPKANNEKLIQKNLGKIKEEMDCPPLEYLIQRIVGLLDKELKPLENVREEGCQSPYSFEDYSNPFQTSFSNYFQ